MTDSGCRNCGGTGWTLHPSWSGKGDERYEPCECDRRTPPTPATEAPWEGPLTDKENAMLKAAWQKHKDAAPPTPAFNDHGCIYCRAQGADCEGPHKFATEEREAVALAMLNGKRVREGWPVTAAIPEGFVDGDEWRLEAQDALSALAPIRAQEILAAEARGAERERASKGTVTTYKRGFGPGDGDSAIEHGAGK